MKYYLYIYIYTSYIYPYSPILKNEYSDTELYWSKTMEFNPTLY